MHVPSPGFAPSSEIAGTFLSSPPVARSLKKARSADVVLVSVGIVGCESLLVAEGFMTEEAMTEVTDAGAVGEVFGWYFDADGNSVQAPSLHPVALTLDDLRSASRVIGVAGGVEKAGAIRGAIAAGILDELAIDETLAEELLRK
jgi:DNA-binding transcriptional regulator LsrR (DeoR family)